jgi:phage tail sheath protein FI
VVDRRAVVRDSRMSGSGRLAVVAVGAALVIVAAKKGRKRVKAAASVYVEEVSSGARPIEAVGTSIAAFVGVAPS